MYFANLDPVIGSKQGGNRPVLVIQNNVGNSFSSTVIVAPSTTQIKKMCQMTHIGIPPISDLPQDSMVMLEQIRTIDKSRLGEYVGCLDDDVMDRIDEALGISVGLEDVPLQAGRCGRADESTRQKAPDGMVLTLCGVCLKQFINSPEYIVRRVDRTQTNEPCMYCNIRGGYDYRIIHRKKRLGDDRY